MAKKVGSIYAEIRAKLDRYEKDLQRAHSQTVAASSKIQKSIDNINFDRAADSISIFRTKIVGLFAGVGTMGIAKSVLDVNASFERMQAKLDTLNPGKGKETFNYLYNLVRDLPTGIESITQGFITMTAMGLKPTERQILTLIDAASVLGEETFGRIVLQLGQMTTKGKVMAEDLTILAEAGINARDMIKQAFGMTVDEIQKTGVDIRHVTDTIFEGMELSYGGASKRMATTWDGVTTQMKKAWQDLGIVLGDAGFFEAAKNSIKELTEQVKIFVQFANLRSVLGTRAEGYQFISKGIINKEVFEAADVYRKQEMVDWARKFEVAGFDTSDPDRGSIPVGYRSGLTKGITDKRHLVSNVNAIKNESKAAATEVNKFRQEIEKLQQEFEQSKIFSGEGSQFEKMEQQLRSIGAEYNKFGEDGLLISTQESVKNIQNLGGAISQMYAEAAETARKQAAEQDELLIKQLEEYEEQNKKTFSQLDELTERTAEAMQQNFSELFFDSMTGELKSLEDYATAVFTSIQRMVADIAAQQLTQGLFGPEMKGGGWLSGLSGGGGLLTSLMGLFGGGSTPTGMGTNTTFGGGGSMGGFLGMVKHQGGTYSSGGAVKNISASAFSFAPRLHNGLMPDEYPAVLQKGETVIPKGRGMSNNVTINIAAPNGKLDRESLSNVQASLFAALSRSARRNN